MVKFFLAAVLTLTTVLSANAQKQDRVVIHAGQFTSLDIGENMEVVLVQAGTADSITKIDGEIARNLRVVFSSRTIHISPQHYSSPKTIVYVLVNDLRFLTLGRGTKVQSEGNLKITKLEMFVSDASLARLRTDGKVKAYAVGDYEISIQRTPVVKVINGSL